MLVDEANKQKEHEFEKIQNKIDDLIIECEEMYRFLLNYNDLITYEELYTLSEMDISDFLTTKKVQ